MDDVRGPCDGEMTKHETFRRPNKDTKIEEQRVATSAFGSVFKPFRDPGVLDAVLKLAEEKLLKLKEKIEASVKREVQADGIYSEA